MSGLIINSVNVASQHESGSRYFCLLLLIILCTWSNPSSADIPGLDNIVLGVRMGYIERYSDGLFREYDLMYQHPLKWGKQLSSDWALSSYLKANIGNLNTQGEDTLMTAFGGGVVLHWLPTRWSFDLSLQPTYLNDDQLGERDMGGEFHFSSQATIIYRYSDRLSIGYGYKHISNNGFDHRNPGLNMHLLEFRFNFE